LRHLPWPGARSSTGNHGAVIRGDPS